MTEQNPPSIVQNSKPKRAKKPVFPAIGYLTSREDEKEYVIQLRQAVAGSYLEDFLSQGAISWLFARMDEDHSTDLHGALIYAQDTCRANDEEVRQKIKALNEAQAMISELRADVHNVSLELRQAREDALRLATADNEKRLKLDEFERELDITKAQARYSAEHNAELLQRNQELTDSWNEMHQAQSGLEKTIQERDIDILCKDAEICRLKALLWDMTQAK